MSGWLTGDVNNGPAFKKAGSSSNSSNSSGSSGSSGSPSAAISYNAPSGTTSSNVVVGQSPSSNDYNGGTKEEWEYYFGDNDSSYDYDAIANQYAQQLAAYKAEQEALAAEQEAAKKKAIQAAVDQTTNKLNAQKTTTSQEYADMYRQLYLNNMKSQKNIGQQMAAQGVTGGASESTLLGLNTDYEDNLRQGKTSEQNALAELEQGITDAQLSGDIEAANAAYDTAAQKASAYSTAYQQYLSALQNAQSQAASQASASQQYAQSQVNYMLQMGVMPSDALLEEAGMSKSDAQTILAGVKASTATSYTGSNTKTANDNDDGTTQTKLGNAASYKADRTLVQIYVKGYGYLSVSDVEKAVANGKIKKSVANGVVTYTKA